MSLTGIKEVDYKILNELDDKSLVNFCSADKRADEYCNDQVFWMNRILTLFPYLDLDILRRYKGDRSWSEYYILDLRKVLNSRSPLDDKKSITDNRLDHIKILVEKGVPERDRYTFVHNAVIYDRVEILKYLLSKEFPIGNVNEHLRRAFAPDMIKYLVSLGADIHNNYQELLRNFNTFGLYRPELFRIGDLLKIIKYLHDIGEDIHYDNEFLLRTAVRLGEFDAVKYLVEHEANIHANDEVALLIAANFGYLNIVKYLVEQGADIHFNRDAAVRHAHEKGRANIVNYLVSQGAADPRIY